MTIPTKLLPVTVRLLLTVALFVGAGAFADSEVLPPPLRSARVDGGRIVVGPAISTLALQSAHVTERTLDQPGAARAAELFEEGRATFRFQSFGSQGWFSRTLKLHRAVRELPPVAALGLGLKVDVDRLPQAVIDGILGGEVDLEDPANTVALVLLESIVGVRGRLAEGTGKLVDVGITCALCHSTVDDSLLPGVGRRLDGWANRDLDVGAIVGAAPELQPLADALGVDAATVRAVLASWGPGRFDAHLNLDGKAFRPDGRSASVLIPSAFGLAGVNLATYTGWGSVTYWNAFVASHEMNGRGAFSDPRLDDPVKFPIAAALGLDQQRDDVDAITRRLPALQLYQLSLEAPPAPAGSYDVAAAARGRALFEGRARCATCHVPPLYTEPGHNLHRPEEIGIDDFQASRSPTGGYRTTPLRGLWTRDEGGYYHDGRFADLTEVVEHYDAHLGLGLSADEVADLVELLRSL